MDRPLAPLADVLISVFDQEAVQQQEGKIAVNPLVSKVATWYERLRNVMEYREDEIILRAAIERILKRRILWGGNPKKIAEPLIRELIWARYFPNNSFSDEIISLIEEKIGLYIQIREQMVNTHRIKEDDANDWFYHLLSSDIEYTLNPRAEKETMTNFMFQVMKDQIEIADDHEQNRDVQVFIAVRRAFSRDDLAFLRYQLFTQYFGVVTSKTVHHIGQNFLDGYNEIQQQLAHPRKETIYTYVKDKTAVFLILYDLLQKYKGSLRQISQDGEELRALVFGTCEEHYQQIAKKVQRSIIKSVIFILLTKVFFAFAVEGTYERIRFGHILVGSILLNTGIPPILMIIVGILIRPPAQDNSERIFTYIKRILFEDRPNMGKKLTIRKYPDQSQPILNMIFTMLWFCTFLLSFGFLIYVLSKLHFNVVSQGIFLFFLAVVSFLSYRIRVNSRVYTIEERQGWLTPLADFFFMPVVRVGRYFTDGISQINIFLFIFDFIIETPFKGLFGFVEQWFFFLYSKREKLG